MRELHDHYFREAKKHGYLSRAAYKLMEIDDRKKLLHPGDRVLDCGAAPGSWLQVASERVGPRGAVVGIDLSEIRHRFERNNIQHIQGDLRETPPQTLLDLAGGVKFDVILSDMAPNTSGDRSIDHFGSVRLCQAVLDRAGELLRPGGNLLMKVFEGEAYPELLESVRRMFDSVKGFKPKASRSESTEIYIVAHGYRAPSSHGKHSRGRTAGPADLAPARPRPLPGWNG
jgi:23S rRNA (uridine2552-2'-O)-methyltransferase